MRQAEANYEARRWTAGYIDGLVSDESLWEQFFSDKSEKDQARLRKAFERLAAKLGDRNPTTPQKEQVKE